MITARRTIRHLRRSAKPVTSGRRRSPQRTAVLAAQLRSALLASLQPGGDLHGATSQRLLQAKLMMVLRKAHRQDGVDIAMSGPHAKVRAQIEARRLRDALQLAARSGNLAQSPALLALQQAVDDLVRET